MAKARSSRLENPTARLKLATRKKPYGTAKLSPGISLLYRRNAGAGTWIVRVASGRGKYWTKAIGIADDYEPAGDDGPTLNYWQAQKQALAIARSGDAEVVSTKPITVKQAIEAYQKDLIVHNMDPRPVGGLLSHLQGSNGQPSPLLARPVALLKVKELKDWRDGLFKKGTIKAATVNRVMTPLRAALYLAAQDDERITNSRAWRVGLAQLPGGGEARRCILSDDVVRRIIASSYTVAYRFGLLVEFLATTGCRFSQAIRVEVGGLLIDRVMIPPSDKGGRKKEKPALISFPLGAEFINRLRAECDGRADTEMLFRRPDGRLWDGSHGPPRIGLWQLLRLVLIILGNRRPIQICVVLAAGGVAPR
jgi:hypothetical protein